MIPASERIRNLLCSSRLKRFGFLLLVIAVFAFAYKKCYTSRYGPQKTFKSARPTFLEIKDYNFTDPKLLEYLRRHVLIPPSKLPYNLTEESANAPSYYKKELNQILGNKKTGFFIECGAKDGEFLSNTLHLEKEGWTGLLVEAQPEWGKELLTKNRKAWIANVCLSPYLHISEMGEHRLVDEVPCFPLVSLLSAIGVKHVDYFFLGFEGVERQILKTLPFDETLVIDCIHVETVHLPGEESAIKIFLETRGYDFVVKHGIDEFYKRRDYNSAPPDFAALRT
ncbi:unnamed protein product [Allacma fusca]|uniref:Methyltransferase FkbM domain-containing protein n=1 Tax=Allacma fusca TaxID=39272 RepID=A0A8J2LHB0_9HEXA|nr:unnamed protein product [Allacma fusca]